MGRHEIRNLIVVLCCLSATMVAGPAAQQQRNADVEVAVSFVRQGDFEAGVEALQPLTQALEGLPRQIRELARAYLYLGIAELGRGRPERAKEAFQEAQRRDRQLDVQDPEFSQQVRQAFADARTFTPAPPPVAQPEAPPPPPPAAVAVSAPGDPGAWIRQNNDVTTVGVALGRENGRCLGSLQISRTNKMLRWLPDQGEPCESWQVPFAEIRAVVAAPRGGFSFQLRKQDAGRRVFMPAPEADLLLDGVDALTLSQFTASARVAVRSAVAAIEDAVGLGSDRPPGPTSANPAVFASLAELMETPAEFAGRPVRTAGRLDVVSREKGQYVLYADQFSVMIRPQSSVALRLKSDAERLKDQEVEVVGAFSRLSNPVRLNSRTPSYAISFWTFELPNQRETSAEPLMTLEGLATADRLPQGPVRVIGKFRSFNTLADLPIGTRKSRNDWVIKDDVYAAWVGGRPPSGDGWNLASMSSGEAFQWVEVTATAEETQGALYLRASRVRLSPPPSAGASVRAAPRPELRMIVPEVQFTSPIEGLEDTGPDGRFLVQFTKTMDAKSFAGRVELRYSESPGSQFPGMRTRYFETRRVLEVDPGVALVPGQTVELVLRDGIVDSDAVALRAEPNLPTGIVRLLRWKVSE